MNKYLIQFVFDGQIYQVVFTANQLANSVIGNDDDILDFICKEDEQYHAVNFTASNKKKYAADFSEPMKLNIYYGENNDVNDGFIAAKDVPWQLMAVKDCTGEIVYNLIEGFEL